MSKDKHRYGASAVPEGKNKETSVKRTSKPGGKMEEIEEAIARLEDQIKKQNRDNLDAMYNIDEDQLSSSYRKRVNGKITEAYALISTWAKATEAGFQSIAKWQQELEDDLSGYVTTTELAAGIKGYLNGEEGKAAITSAVSGKFVTKDDLGSYVQTSSLNASIQSYINGTEGKAAIESAVSGKYVKIDGDSGITSTSQVVSKITQSVSSGIAQLTLGVSNGDKSSTITLKNGQTTLSSQTITLAGDVVFKSDLSTAGATTINGANIMTGTISADVVDTSTLVVENVWLGADIISGKKILTSKKPSDYNLVVQLGVQENTGWAQFVEIYGTIIYMSRPGYSPSKDKNALAFNLTNSKIQFPDDDVWEIGDDSCGLSSIYAGMYYFSFGVSGDRPRIYVNASTGDLIFKDRNGDTHKVVDIG